MSAFIKNYGKRQDAIITDCFVVMPDGVTDGEGNRRYCKIENAAWNTGATNTVITPEVIQALGLSAPTRCPQSDILRFSAFSRKKILRFSAFSGKKILRFSAKVVLLQQK